MSEKTRAALLAGVASAYPDNTSGAITPLAARTESNDMVDSSLLLAETILQTVVGPVNYTGVLTKSGAPVVTGLITINVEADFPTQDGSTITLESGFVYVVVSSFSTAKGFVCEDGSTITAFNQFGIIVTYTGVSDMFSGVDVTFKIQDIGLGALNGQYYNFADSAILNTHTFFCQNVTHGSCVKFGTLESMSSFVISESAVLGGADDGLTILGNNWRVWRFQNGGLSPTSATFIGIDMGTATVSAVAFTPLLFAGPAGAVAFSGAAGSANIIAGNTGRINESNYIGDITPLAGITNEDVRWDFQSNSRIPDSVNEADLYLTGGAETITTGSAGDWQEIGVPGAGGVTWASDIASRFTVGTDGVITYDGERDICLRVSGRATVEKVGGGSDIIEVRLAKNWTGVVSDSGIEKSRAQTQNTAATSVPIGALIGLTNGDDIRVIFSNVTGTSNIIANVSAVEVA